jgi:hypothetical protein
MSWRILYEQCYMYAIFYYSICIGHTLTHAPHMHRWSSRCKGWEAPARAVLRRCFFFIGDLCLSRGALESLAILLVVGVSRVVGFVSDVWCSSWHLCHIRCCIVRHHLVLCARYFFQDISLKKEQKGTSRAMLPNRTSRRSKTMSTTAPSLVQKVV